MAYSAAVRLLAAKHVGDTAEDGACQAAAALVLRGVAGGLPAVVILWLIRLAGRREKVGRQLSHEFPGAALSATATASATLLTAKELGREGSKPATSAAAAAVTRILATEEGVHGHALGRGSRCQYTSCLGIQPSSCRLMMKTTLETPWLFHL